MKTETINKQETAVIYKITSLRQVDEITEKNILFDYTFRKLLLTSIQQKYSITENALRELLRKNRQNNVVREVENGTKELVSNKIEDYTSKLFKLINNLSDDLITEYGSEQWNKLSIYQKATILAIMVDKVVAIKNSDSRYRGGDTTQVNTWITILQEASKSSKIIANKVAERLDSLKDTASNSSIIDSVSETKIIDQVVIGQS